MTGLANSGADEKSAAEEDLSPIAWLPTGPWGFLWHFVRRYYARRYIAMIATVLVAQGIETFEPYILKRLINSLTAVVRENADRTPVTHWFIAAIIA